jgi:hypothetical protein
MGDAIQALDVDRLLSVFADDARWGSHLGPWFGTMEEFKPAVREGYSGITETSVETDEVFVRVLGPYAALVGTTSTAPLYTRMGIRPATEQP